MNKFKRWYYELPEKDVKKISILVGIISNILFVVVYFYFFNELPKGNSFLALCSLSIFLALTTYAILWTSPYKQVYLYKKRHDEIIPKVRKRFGLGPEFKEVLYTPLETDYDFIDFIKISNELGVKYFAEEIDGVILVSIRNSDGKELESQEIDNYYFFDSNFSPKE